ncbi:hypothetical protein BOTNAR_0006g00590 [Botryotinia narcissicola]|uniref:Uncharacterized protein n=1 Tax=Botryotinia narcissicola TaxID=278944 RepID=A0A4Z1JED5_9HELO|nr:hypothetical protein BOTNAR_0006g00590 [Botryotinia narcissicola]
MDKNRAMAAYKKTPNVQSCSLGFHRSYHFWLLVRLEMLVVVGFETGKVSVRGYLADALRDRMVVSGNGEDDSNSDDGSDDDSDNASNDDDSGDNIDERNLTTKRG